MPKKVAINSIIVVRGGKPVTVKPGETFDFTKDELDDFKLLEDRHNEDQKNTPEGSRTTFRAVVRDPVNEAPEVDDDKAAKKTTGKTAAGDL